MKRYLVDVSGLSADEKEATYKKINDFAFMVACIHDKNKVMTSLVVYWADQDDFKSSPLCPPNCPCSEV